MRYQRGTAWSDYLDARLRLVHDWAGEGVGFEEMVDRLECDAHDLALLLLQPTVPPRPGCSRDQLVSTRIRLERAEKELLRAAAPPPAPERRPPNSQVRALLLDPDPALCGCQFWTDNPRPGNHHPQCAHATPS